MRAAALIALFFALPCLAAPVRVTLLHTNDLHSHFRPDRTPLQLGGIGRIATAARAIRRENPATLLVDGGDWSEGDIYFRDGLGRESLRLMDEIGYDVAVVGNHDWLNGPDELLAAIRDVEPRMALVGANIDASAYKSGAEFTRRVLPYVIREIGGVRIGIIGLVTHEFIFDRYLRPVQIQKLTKVTRRLARELRPKVDVLMAISHNIVRANDSLIADVPELDLIVGAHDHVKLERPHRIARKGRPDGLVVEAGSWGQYLGRMELDVEPGTGRPPRLASYRLLQLDRRMPEDPAILARLDALEARLEERYGPIFHDDAGESRIEIVRDGIEGPIGDLVADALRAATGADAALEEAAFVYGNLHAGRLRTVDLYNANPGVYSPASGKSWTARIIPIRGTRLRQLLNLLYSSSALAQHFGLGVSGMQIIFNPLLRSDFGSTEPSPLFTQLLEPRIEGLILREFLIGGEELDSDRVYRIAAGGGVVEALEFLNSILPNAVPLEDVVDTGVEAWRVLAAHVRLHSPISRENFSAGQRVRTAQPDLGIRPDDIERTAAGNVKARISNFGASRSEGAMLHLSVSGHGMDFGLAPEWADLAPAVRVPALEPGASATLEWNSIVVPEDHGLSPLTVRLTGMTDEVDTVNDSATRWE